MCVCKKCMTLGGWVFSVFAFLFLLRDLGVWGFWGISWYTALFAAVGVGYLGSSKCPDCDAARMGKGKK